MLHSSFLLTMLIIDLPHCTPVVFSYMHKQAHDLYTNVSVLCMSSMNMEPLYIFHNLSTNCRYFSCCHITLPGEDSSTIRQCIESVWFIISITRPSHPACPTCHTSQIWLSIIAWLYMRHSTRQWKLWHHCHRYAQNYWNKFSNLWFVSTQLRVRMLQCTSEWWIEIVSTVDEILITLFYMTCNFHEHVILIN